MTQYNKSVRYFEYEPGELVWVRKRKNNPGEHRKLSPRYSGPNVIIQKMPNSVNYEIKGTNGKISIIHHDRLTEIPILKEKPRTKPITQCMLSSDEGVSESESDSEVIQDAPERRYPLRNRTPRIIEGTVPWEAIDHLVKDFKAEVNVRCCVFSSLFFCFALFTHSLINSFSSIV